MVVVMKERATEAQIDAVIARLIELGMDVHRSSGSDAHRARRRRRTQGRSGTDRHPRRRARGAAHHRALQARQPHVQAGGHGRHARRRADRRRRSDRHGRAVLGGDRRAGHGERGRRQASRRRRSCAAARSSRAARRTASRALARRGCRCSGALPTRTT